MKITDKILKEIRLEYGSRQLTRNDLKKEPIETFQDWFNDALISKVKEPNAMVLATLKNNSPKARYVLFKGIINDSIIFFSNYDSKKGKEIEKNNFVSLVFYWREIHRQIRIEGKIKKTSKNISDDYFNSRTDGAKISAISSPQSKIIKNREILEKRIQKIKAENSKLKRPDFWGGYIVKPSLWEFWQGRDNRSHDRFVFQEKNGNWEIFRLAP
tara:strand:+ start:254 stop:895 length:642 start_codon:yes stop_codon:yes gene_type:complete